MGRREDINFIFNEPRIVLDVGAHITQLSVLLWQSILSQCYIGVSRHNLETMQCQDGNFLLI